MTTEKTILHKNGLEQISKIRRNNKHKLRKEHQKESLKCILNVDTKTNLFAALSFLWFVFKWCKLFLLVACLLGRFCCSLRILVLPLLLFCCGFVVAFVRLVGSAAPSFWICLLGYNMSLPVLRFYTIQTCRMLDRNKIYTALLSYGIGMHDIQ